MKKKYTKPSIKVIKLKKEDIITTSGTLVTDAIFGQGNGGANVK